MQSPSNTLPNRPIRPFWSQEEDNYLKELVGDYPIKLLTTHYNHWASSAGYPNRTLGAIQSRIFKFSGTTVPTGLWITAKDLSIALNVSKGLPALWVRQGWIEPRHFHKAPRRLLHIHRDGIKRLLKRKPNLASFATRENLFFLLEDEKLTDLILSKANDHPIGRSSPVLCIETQRVYSSIAAAARINRIDRFHISRAVNDTTRTAGNLHWKKIPPTSSLFPSKQPRRAPTR